MCHVEEEQGSSGLQSYEKGESLMVHITRTEWGIAMTLTSTLSKKLPKGFEQRRVRTALTLNTFLY